MSIQPLPAKEEKNISTLCNDRPRAIKIKKDEEERKVSEGRGQRATFGPPHLVPPFTTNHHHHLFLAFHSFIPHSFSTPTFLLSSPFIRYICPDSTMSVNSTKPVPTGGFKGSDLPPLVTDRPPRVLIAGGGLGGLFLGILLEKAGIPYEIFERSAEIKPLGKKAAPH